MSNNKSERNLSSEPIITVNNNNNSKNFNLNAIRQNIFKNKPMPATIHHSQITDTVGCNHKSNKTCSNCEFNCKSSPCFNLVL